MAKLTIDLPRELLKGLTVNLDDILFIFDAMPFREVKLVDDDGREVSLRITKPE